MYWDSESASFFEDIEIKCSVCGQAIKGQDLVYMLRCNHADDDKREERMEMLFGVDPLGNFHVCEKCVEGKTADKWLESQWSKKYSSGIKIQRVK
ncbi:MAG: hypothetical protein ACLFRO_05045 [Desulfobacterales bacterium]